MLTFQAIFSYNRCQSRCYIRRKQSNLHLYISGEAPALTITAPSCSVLSLIFMDHFQLLRFLYVGPVEMATCIQRVNIFSEYDPHYTRIRRRAQYPATVGGK